MKSFKPLVPAALALLLGCNSLAAQTVYRCGNSYSQSPCPGAVAVQADDPRSEEQRTAAQQGLVRDKALAKEMEASRRKDEALALAQDRAAIARAAAAHKMQTKKSTGKKSASAKTHSAKIRLPAAATASGSAAKRKKKASGNSEKD